MLKRSGVFILRNVLSLLNWLIHTPWIPFLLIFSLTFAAGVDDLMKIPSRYLVPSAYRELGAIAISFMKTGQLANPYMIPTGPTAYLPPIIPFIIGMINCWFGLTSKAGYVSRLFVIMNGSLLFAMHPWLSEKLGTTKQAGFIGGLAGPLHIEWHGHGEYLTGILMGLFLVVFLRRWTKNIISWRGSLLLGLAIGATLHVQPALLPVILGCIAFELWWSRNRRKWAFISVLALGIVIACIPWAWRNYTTFNTLFFVRSNFGLELRLGNHEGAAAAIDVIVEQEKRPHHPKALSSEARKLRDIGEIAYMRGAMDDALEWIIANPVEFLRLTGLRVLHIWFGPLHNSKVAAGISVLTLFAFLGLWLVWKRLLIPQQAILLIPLVTYSLIYYLVAYMPRYRVPIDWILFMLAGFTVWYWIGRSIKEKE